jgi:KaiC/GvpD/RAD55 family RecA-like ATPase
MQETMFEGYICSRMKFFGQVKQMRVSRLVKTGISGFDELLGGGIPDGNIVLVSGECGSGKTIFALQFLYNGAVEYGERGVYISLDEKPDLVRKRARPFGWDFRDLELDGKIAILDAYATLAKLPTAEKIKVLGPLEITSFITGILETLERVSAKRVVIDSITAFAYQFVDPKKIRDVICRIFALLRELKCTAIITSEIDLGEGKLSRWGVEEFLADGVIRLFSYTSRNESRALRIVKMKGAKHPLTPIPFRIAENGIVLEKLPMIPQPKVTKLYY